MAAASVGDADELGVVAGSADVAAVGAVVGGWDDDGEDGARSSVGGGLLVGVSGAEDVRLGPVFDPDEEAEFAQGSGVSGDAVDGEAELGGKGVAAVGEVSVPIGLVGERFGDAEGGRVCPGVESASERPPDGGEEVVR